MLTSVVIPDLFEKEDCTLLTNEQIAELHKQEVLKVLNKNKKPKTIAMSTHIVILNEG